MGLFGEEFKQAYVVLNIVVITYLVGAVFGPTGAMFNMTNNQKYFSRVILIALIINLVLNLLLIPIYALEGAAIASLVSMAFWNVYSFYQLKKLGLA